MLMPRWLCAHRGEDVWVLKASPTQRESAHFSCTHTTSVWRRQPDCGKSTLMDPTVNSEQWQVSGSSRLIKGQLWLTRWRFGLSICTVRHSEESIIQKNKGFNDAWKWGLNRDQKVNVLGIQNHYFHKVNQSFFVLVSGFTSLWTNCLVHNKSLSLSCLWPAADSWLHYLL